MSADTRPGTYQSVNAALRKLGAQEKLVAGKGYCYFIEGDASDWYMSSVAVCRINHLTVAQWIDTYQRMKAEHEAKK